MTAVVGGSFIKQHSACIQWIAQPEVHSFHHRLRGVSEDQRLNVNQECNTMHLVHVHYVVLSGLREVADSTRLRSFNPNTRENQSTAE